MTPEEKLLLNRVVKLSEENNRMIRSVRRHIRWSFAWGVLKFLLIIIPLAIGFLYVKDNLNQPTSWMDQMKEIVDSLR